MINKNLMLVAMLSMGTALTTLGKVKPALASLTPPTSYDYSYTWNAAASEQYLNVNGVDSIPLYTRTADGAYYNYTSTFEVIYDLDVTMFFGRSTTTWQASGISWKPDEARIGSDSTVGSITNKVSVTYSNQTSNDYLLYFDQSSKGAQGYYAYKVNGQLVYGEAVGGGTILLIASGLNQFYIPAFSIVEMYVNVTASQYYFDAWYLRDLGISDAYQAGYDANRAGILTDYLGTDAQQIGWVLLGIAAILFVFKGGK
jgi:hypothetical protein